ncbi:MAG: alpha/beta hydrolase [Defluviitaleaceae bacterium]|nr:alpha/beta hydrolase [Defluviitaleaceae bacterium]
MFTAVNQIISLNELNGILPTGELVEVNGKMMHVRSMGDGEQIIVILPGLGTPLPTESFAPLMRELSVEYTVVAVEYFGLGHSDRTDAPRTNAAFTEEIRSALAGAGFAPPFILMPHSASGSYAEYFAVRHPEEIAALVLLDTIHTHEVLEPNVPGFVTHLSGFSQFVGSPGLLSPVLMRAEGIVPENGFTPEEIQNIRRFMNHYVNSTTMNHVRMYITNIREVTELDFPQDIPVLSIRPTRPNPGSAMTIAENNIAHMERFGENSQMIIIEGNHSIHMGNHVEVREAVNAFFRTRASNSPNNG